MKQIQIDRLAEILNKQIDKQEFERKYAPIREVLKLVGAGAFLAASVAMPKLPSAMKSFLRDEEEYEAWKRFNIPYLKRAIERLEKQKLVEFGEEQGMQVIKITQKGRQKVLRFAIESLGVEKPEAWD